LLTNISIGNVPFGIASSFTKANKTKDGYVGESEFTSSTDLLSISPAKSLLYKFHTVPECTTKSALNSLPLSNCIPTALLSSINIFVTSVL
jgi:hypothetical protein